MPFAVDAVEQAAGVIVGDLWGLGAGQPSMTWACFLLSFSCERWALGLVAFDWQTSLLHQARIWASAKRRRLFVHDLPGLLRIQVSGQTRVIWSGTRYCFCRASRSSRLTA